MKPLKKMLASTHALASLEEKLDAQKDLLQRIRALLPQPLDEHCVWAIRQHTDLTLLVDSPVWASRLRYLAPQLSRQLRQQALQVKRIRVKVTVLESRGRRRTAPKRANPISQANADLLSSLARSIDDEGLRKALLRLSRRSSA